MRKNNHFNGQPLYSQLIKLLDKSKILDFSRENGGESYTKRFNCWIPEKEWEIMLSEVSDGPPEPSLFD